MQRRCYCRYKWCDGALVARSTWRYHNQIARPQAPTAEYLAAHPAVASLPGENATDLRSSSASTLSQQTTTTGNTTNTGLPHTSGNQVSSSTPVEPQTPRLQTGVLSEDPLTPRQRRLPREARNAELASRDRLEILGEDYTNGVLAEDAHSDAFADIGTVDGDYGADVSDSEDDAERDPLAPPAPPPAPGSTEPRDTQQWYMSEQDLHDIYQGDISEEAPADTISFDDCHPALLLLYLLVTWLHTQFKTPFRACGAVLSVVYHILLLAGVDPELTGQGWTTLPTVLSRLGIEPNFRVILLCTSCKYPHPPTSDKSAKCIRCEAPLFKITARSSRRPGATETVRPHLQMPVKSIEAQLRDILAVPGIEDELEKWRSLPRTANFYQDNFDGRVCQELPGPDNRPFFANPLPPDTADELRIGLTLGVDWFSYLRSQITASHASAPLSFNIINLPPHLRYRTVNLLLSAIFPGPREQSGDEIQPIMRIFVNELLRLWYNGFWIVTTKYPFGRRVRVILVCVICDKPAAHKMGGFGSHSAQFFCTKCWIRQKDKTSAQAFEHGGFRARSHAEQMELGKRYEQLTTDAARKQFIHDYATRNCELSRLPYFDVCRMIIIDPMHNLLLGLAKTHFYNIWIQLKVLRKRRELLRLHSILETFQIPSHMGRLPALMGEPAGGSLTADQWLLSTTVVAPIAIPQIWDEYCVVQGFDAEAVRQRRIAAIAKNIDDKKEAQRAAREAKKAAKARADAEAASRAAAASTRPKRTRKPTARSQYVEVPLNDGGPEDDVLDAGAFEEELDAYNPAGGATEDDAVDDDDSNRAPNLHPDDPANFFKLSTALDLLLSRKLWKQDVVVADALLAAYCKELMHLYGPEVIKPNHHYAMHIAECVYDFGPLHGFWTFLFERINKVLKSYNSANHSGGELEVSFFREFHRTVQQARVMAKLRKSGNIFFSNSFDLMSAATADDRGTVQALARELDTPTKDESAYALSPRAADLRLQGELYNLALRHVGALLPFPIRAYTDFTSNAVPFMPHAIEHDWVTVNHRRYWASSRAKKIDNSVIAASVNGHIQYGELVNIYSVPQPHLGLGTTVRFARVKWFVPAIIDVTHSAWASSSMLGVAFWEVNQYEGSGEGACLIDLAAITSLVSRDVAVVQGHRCWVTKRLSRA